MSETCQHGVKLTKPCFDCDDHPIPTTESELAAVAGSRFCRIEAAPAMPGFVRINHGLPHENLGHLCVEWELAKNVLLPQLLTAIDEARAAESSENDQAEQRL